jgi:hypothetical protein
MMEFHKVPIGFEEPAYVQTCLGLQNVCTASDPVKIGTGKKSEGKGRGE